MNRTITNKQLHELRMGVMIYSPLYLYSLLRIKEGTARHDKETDQAINKLAGLALAAWPKDSKDDYYKLLETLLSLEELKNTFAEIHYFLIYTIAGYVSKYINQDDQKTVLDALFDLFNDRKIWESRYPENTAFTKYRESENFLLEFSNQISKTTGMTDSLLLADYAVEVSSINKFFIQPALDKIFSDKN